jgi:hypothetical protein
MNAQKHREQASEGDREFDWRKVRKEKGGCAGTEVLQRLYTIPPEFALVPEHIQFQS